MNQWKVTSTFIGVKMWQVYRQRPDGTGVDHAGSREYADKMFNTRATAQAYADKLNADAEE